MWLTVEYLPLMHKILGSIPCTTKQTNKLVSYTMYSMKLLFKYPIPRVRHLFSLGSALLKGLN